MITPALRQTYLYWREHGRSPVVSRLKAFADLAARKARYLRTSCAFGKYALEPNNWKTRFIDKADLDSFGLRFVGYADEIRPRAIDHRGWYADAFQDSIYRAAVLQLPGAKGCARFVAAYQESHNDGFLVDLSSVTIGERGDYCRPQDDDAALDVALSADGLAERAAEKAREYDETWNAGREYAEEGESIVTARREALAILGERRGLPDLDKPNLCAAIRHRVTELCEQIAESRSKRQELRDSAWREYQDAFNEGAGETVFAS